MFYVKNPGQSSVLSRYQPNASNLHNSASKPNTPSNKPPPLPAGKPPLLHKPSNIPTKMQNLEPSVVNRFLQAVNGESNATKGNAGNGVTFKSEHSLNIQSSPSTNHSWLHRTPSAEAKPQEKANGTTLKTTQSSPSPLWMNKSAEEVPKPTWNAKTSQVQKSVQWTPDSASSSVEEKKGVVSAYSLESPSNKPEYSNAGDSQKSKWKSRDEDVAKIKLKTVEDKKPEWAAPRVNSDWKSKYDEAERRRKELLAESQKVTRDKVGLERKLQKLENDFKTLEAEHREKSHQLSKLSKVSEKVYEDYDNLHQKYEVETSALQRALGIASKWYQENKKLKRESIARSPTAANPLDELDGYDQDQLEDLKNNVQELSQKVAKLQSELNRAKLLEFETQEQNANLAQQLDEEREKSQRQEKELKDLRIMREKFEGVTLMVQGEVESLRQQRDRALEQLSRLENEAHQAKKERNVLAHQSSLLMGDIGPDDRLFNVLLEVEELKRKLEEEEHKHAIQIQSLQESIEERQSDSQMELLEQKLELAESELQLALERAEQAEQALAKAKTDTARTAAPPCPPPPPPPPPMPNLLGGNNPPLKKPIHRPTEGDSLEDMARLLGIERAPKPVIPPGGVAINELINEIKGGKFTLKATEKQQTKKEEPPPAVQEMLSIIGTLKRRPRQSRQAGVIV